MELRGVWRVLTTCLVIVGASSLVVTTEVKTMTTEAKTMAPSIVASTMASFSPVSKTHNNLNATDTNASFFTDRPHMTTLPSVDGPPNDTCRVLCSGEILRDVQLRNIFPDSKYFVDMKLLGDPEVIIADYAVRKNKTGRIDDEELMDFLHKWFDKPGTDIEKVAPLDFVANPEFILEVHDMKLRNWLLDLNSKWKTLMRRSPEDVKDNERLYSQIYLPHPFVVPGGRFRELHYWSSYWIAEGLFLCEMKASAINMIKNMLHLVELYGYVPNGSRKYYEGRSEIPMLVPMMDLYLKHTRDFKFIKENIHLLDKEFAYWNQKNSLELRSEYKTYSMFRYTTNAKGPRPEEYLVDSEMCPYRHNQTENEFYSNIQAVDVSGWDFSSRWLVGQNHSISNDMLDIRTSKIIPVDLNCLMAHNAEILSNFHKRLGNETKSDYYLYLSTNLTLAIERFLWNEKDGFWFDLDIEAGVLRREFYGSSLMPLWTQSYGIQRNHTYTTRRAIDYLQKSGVLNYPGGLPASTFNGSILQWDLPNGLAPLHAIAVEGLRRASSYDKRASAIALDLATKWIFNNYYTYANKSEHPMMEDYNVVHPGKGSGHFYPNQEGFGWTNAVAMKLLKLYPHEINNPGKIWFFWKYVPAIVLTALAIIVLGVHIGCTVRGRRKEDELERTRLLIEEASDYYMS